MTNNQAIAYMQIALFKQGMTKEEIIHATSIMESCFDLYSEEEAEGIAAYLWTNWDTE